MRERRSWDKRENKCWRSSYCLWVLLLPLVLILSMRKLQGFLLYGLPEENICVYCLLRLIVVHVILTDKILRSYCLNDKNLTLQLELNWFMPSLLTFQLIPIPLGFLWILNDKRRMPCGIVNLACVRPTSSTCLHDQFPLWFSLVFIYWYPLLNIYTILIFKHHLFSPLFQIPKLPPPT